MIDPKGRPVTRADLDRMFQAAAETGVPPEQPGEPPPGWAWDGTGVFRHLDELLAERVPDEVLESPGAGLPRVEIYYTGPAPTQES